VAGEHTHREKRIEEVNRSIGEQPHGGIAQEGVGHKRDEEQDTDNQPTTGSRAPAPALQVSQPSNVMSPPLVAHTKEMLAKGIPATP
jgi:hypothetical protein